MSCRPKRREGEEGTDKQDQKEGKGRRELTNKVAAHNSYPSLQQNVKTVPQTIRLLSLVLVPLHPAWHQTGLP